MPRRRTSSESADFNIETLIAELAQEGEPDPDPAPRWTEGDRCTCRGEIGRVEALGPGCAAVVTDAGRWLFVAIEELSPHS